MWDLYARMFFTPEESVPDNTQKGLSSIGDTVWFDLTAMPIVLFEWENVSYDLEMTGGEIYAEYVGNGRWKDRETKIIFFRQRQTLKQTIVGMGMKMPFEGTNRFLGHMYLDNENNLLKASYQEFVYGKVYAPMGQTVITHTRRDYNIELADN